MVKQYRDVISWQLAGTPATKDPVTGFPIPSVPGETVTAKGRYENFSGTGRKEYVNRDGQVILQKGTIFIKKGQTAPNKFETVTVTSPEFEEVFKGEALNVYEGQLNTTIAV